MNADRRSVAPDDWSTPETALQTFCLAQADMSIHWHATNILGMRCLRLQRVGSRKLEGRYFDVYDATLERGAREYWMDVTYWHGRVVGLMLADLDFPPPRAHRTVADFFGDYELQLVGRDNPVGRRLVAGLKTIRLELAAYSSEQVSQAIATIVHNPLAVKATAVRGYIADDLPLLHGFHFYKLFILHRAIHLMTSYPHQETEPFQKADYEMQRYGDECIDFMPELHRSPSRDFWNYVFWSHRPGAFLEPGELLALGQAARYGIVSGLFTEAELRQTAMEMEVDVEDLFEALAFDVEVDEAAWDEVADT